MRGHSCEQALRAGPDRAGMGKAGRAGPNPLPEGSGRGYKHAGPGHARPIRPGPARGACRETRARDVTRDKLHRASTRIAPDPRNVRTYLDPEYPTD